MFSTEGARPNCLSQGWRAAWPADAPLQPFSSSSLALSPSPSAIVSVSPERYKSDCGISLLTSISSTVNSQVFMKAGSGLASYRDAKVPTIPPFSLYREIYFLSISKRSFHLRAFARAASALRALHTASHAGRGNVPYNLSTCGGRGSRRRTRERPVLATYQV